MRRRAWETALQLLPLGHVDRVHPDARGDIDLVLSVRSVKWDQVSGYVACLEDLKEDVLEQAEGMPAIALRDLLYFTEALPRVFDCIDCEEQISGFCRNLAESIMVLARKTPVSIPEVAEKLLTAYLKDEHAQFEDIPSVLEASRYTEGDRRRILSLIARLSAGTDAYRAEALDRLADGLRRRSTGRTKKGR